MQAEGDKPFALPVFCIGEFIRVVTHHRLFDPPTSLSDAMQFISAILNSPQARLLLPGELYWEAFQTVAEAGGVSGNLVFDAQIAALCREAGVDEILTEDRDFNRFSGLHVRLL